MLSHMVLQQQAPNNALISNRTPKTVKAIWPQETGSQAKTITKTASRIPQQHGDMIISFQLNAIDYQLRTITAVLILFGSPGHALIIFTISNVKNTLAGGVHSKRGIILLIAARFVTKLARRIYLQCPRFLRDIAVGR